MAEFASKGVAGAALGTGIAGTALGVLNSGLLPNLFGGMAGGWNNGCGGWNRGVYPVVAECSDNQFVNRYEAQQSARIAELETEVKLRDANTYTIGEINKLRDYTDRRIERIEHQLCDQAVWNTAQTGTISCMAQQISALQGLTKTVIPHSSICPPVMPRYNSWVAPTETAPDTTGT